MTRGNILKYNLPFKLLILAEFHPRDEGRETVFREPGRIMVDKETFGEVMGRLAGKAPLNVRNRLSDKPEELSVTIPLDGIKSLHPEGIVESVPELRDLAQIRHLVVSLRDGGLSYDEFRAGLGRLKRGVDILSRVEAAVNERKTRAISKQQDYVTPVLDKVSKIGDEKDESLESLFDMVEVPRASAGTSGVSREAASMLDHFISLITAGSTTGTPIDTRFAGQIIADLDDQLSAQVNEVLHHAEFRRLEAVWRGLKFLVDRTDFREPITPITIEVLNTTKNGLLETFSKKVFEPEYEKLQDVPVSVILVDYEFDRSLHDIELLKDLAVKAEMMQTPIISSVGPTFFGIDSISGFASLPYPGNLFQQPEYIKWDSFRKGGSSRWVSLVFNRFLMRDLYGAGHTHVKGFELKESVSGRHGRDYLWGTPVWAMGSLLTASFAGTGWCNDITGVRGGGGVENLPVYETDTHAGQQTRIPLESLISEQMCLDLSENGIIVLTCRLNSDSAVVLYAPTTHRP